MDPWWTEAVDVEFYDDGTREVDLDLIRSVDRFAHTHAALTH
jgi:hypothetical protein